MFNWFCQNFRNFQFKGEDQLSWESNASVWVSFGIFGCFFYRYAYPALVSAADQYRRTIQKNILEMRNNLHSTRSQLEKIKKRIDHFEDIQGEISEEFKDLISKNTEEQMKLFEHRTQQRILQHQRNIQKQLEQHQARIENLIRSRIQSQVFDHFPVQSFSIKHFSLPKIPDYLRVSPRTDS
jgi:F0F1-type ATP synthase membrane subunit b/b'